MSEILDAVHFNMVRKLREARDRKVFSIFTWNRLGFDADQVSQTRILGLLVTAQSGGIPLGGISWRLANNNWTVITALNVPGIFTAMQTHIQTQFAIFASHESIINSMTDPDSVVAYNVEVF